MVVSAVFYAFRTCWPSSVAIFPNNTEIFKGLPVRYIGEYRGHLLAEMEYYIITQFT